MVQGWSYLRRRLLHTQEKKELWRHVYAHAPRERVDCLVVGAGVVGLAIARAMAMHGREVLVVEAAPTFGTATSSRNSEVIHAGIYYPHNSLKALLCVQGRKSLYSYCNEHNVAHKQLGKLIVATHPSQISTLESILLNGRKNGVSDLRFLSGKEVSELEPNIGCVKALLSPSTGIIDSHSFMLSLQADAEVHGATFAFNSSVIQGNVCCEGIEMHVCSTEVLTGQGKPDQMDANSLVLCPKTIVNAAGLNASTIARRLHGFPMEAVPAIFFSRGCYFSLTGLEKAPFSHLVYPIPEEGGLGVHVTLNLSGQVRFGPDVEWLDSMYADGAHQLEFDYTVDPKRAEKFYPEVRKYYPALQDGALKADYAGIRPKISGPHDPPGDFLIQGQEAHGICGLVNLFGIESPGLTASLAIADRVCAMSCRMK
eukprot:c3963_g1_i1 orf=198-1475(+)